MLHKYVLNMLFCVFVDLQQFYWNADQRFKKIVFDENIHIIKQMLSLL